MTSAPQGEDGGLLQCSVTKRAAEMSAAADISAGMGASSHAPAPQERLRFPRTMSHHAGAGAAPGSFDAERFASRLFSALLVCIRPPGRPTPAPQPRALAVQGGRRCRAGALGALQVAGRGRQGGQRGAVEKGLPAATSAGQACARAGGRGAGTSGSSGWQGVGGSARGGPRERWLYFPILATTNVLKLIELARLLHVDLHSGFGTVFQGVRRVFTLSGDR